MASNPPGNNLEEQPHAGWGRLWAALDVHPVEAGALGEYALMLQEQGPEAAERAFPRVAQHVHAGCQHCAAELREFPFPFERAPESGLRRLIATLLAPTPARQLAGTRGSADPLVRSYRAGDLSVSISTFANEPAGDSFAVEGLVTPNDVPGVSVGLSQRHGATQTGVIDERGNFGFDEVAPGMYELELRFDDHVVVVEDLVVGADGGDSG